MRFTLETASGAGRAGLPTRLAPARAFVRILVRSGPPRGQKAVTALIRCLESDGLVARADGPDRRSRLLTLMAPRPAGEQAFVAVNDVLDRALDAGEREQLAALLDRVRAAVDGA